MLTKLQIDTDYKIVHSDFEYANYEHLSKILSYLEWPAYSWEGAKHMYPTNNDYNLHSMHKWVTQQHITWNSTI